MNLRDGTLLKTVFFAMHIGADHFKGQGAFNKHHFAVGPVGDALGFHVKRFDGEVLSGQIVAGAGFAWRKPDGLGRSLVWLGWVGWLAVLVRLHSRSARRQIRQKVLGHAQIVSGALSLTARRCTAARHSTASLEMDRRTLQHGVAGNAMPCEMALEFCERLVLNLAHPLAREPQAGAEGIECLGVAVMQAKPALQNFLFTR